MNGNAAPTGVGNTPPLTTDPTNLDEGALIGAALSVSSNQSVAGTGIVWATAPVMDSDGITVDGVLYAFDAVALAQLPGLNSVAPLWASNQNPQRDNYGRFAKFVPPTVANGKVYVASDSNTISVYGLDPPANPPTIGINYPALIVGAIL